MSDPRKKAAGRGPLALVESEGTSSGEESDSQEYAWEYYLGQVQKSLFLDSMSKDHQAFVKQCYGKKHGVGNATKKTMEKFGMSLKVNKLMKLQHVDTFLEKVEMQYPFTGKEMRLILPTWTRIVTDKPTEEPGRSQERAEKKLRPALATFMKSHRESVLARFSDKERDHYMNLCATLVAGIMGGEVKGYKDPDRVLKWARQNTQYHFLRFTGAAAESDAGETESPYVMRWICETADKIITSAAKFQVIQNGHKNNTYPKLKQLYVDVMYRHYKKISENASGLAKGLLHRTVMHKWIAGHACEALLNAGKTSRPSGGSKKTKTTKQKKPFHFLIGNWDLTKMSHVVGTFNTVASRVNTWAMENRISLIYRSAAGFPNPGAQQIKIKKGSQMPYVEYFSKDGTKGDEYGNVVEIKSKPHDPPQPIEDKLTDSVPIVPGGSKPNVPPKPAGSKSKLSSLPPLPPTPTPRGKFPQSEPTDGRNKNSAKKVFTSTENPVDTNAEKGKQNQDKQDHRKQDNSIEHNAEGGGCDDVAHTILPDGNPRNCRNVPENASVADSHSNSNVSNISPVPSANNSSHLMPDAPLHSDDEVLPAAQHQSANASVRYQFVWNPPRREEEVPHISSQPVPKYAGIKGAAAAAGKGVATAFEGFSPDDYWYDAYGNTQLKTPAVNGKGHEGIDAFDDPWSGFSSVACGERYNLMKGSGKSQLYNHAVSCSGHRQHSDWNSSEGENNYLEGTQTQRRAVNMGFTPWGGLPSQGPQMSQMFDPWMSSFNPQALMMSNFNNAMAMMMQQGMDFSNDMEQHMSNWHMGNSMVTGHYPANAVDARGGGWSMPGQHWVNTPQADNFNNGWGASNWGNEYGDHHMTKGNAGLLGDRLNTMMCGKGFDKSTSGMMIQEKGKGLFGIGERMPSALFNSVGVQQSPLFTPARRASAPGTPHYPRDHFAQNSNDRPLTLTASMIDIDNGGRGWIPPDLEPASKRLRADPRVPDARVHAIPAQVPVGYEQKPITPPRDELCQPSEKIPMVRDSGNAIVEVDPESEGAGGPVDEAGVGGENQSLITIPEDEEEAENSESSVLLPTTPRAIRTASLLEKLQGKSIPGNAMNQPDGDVKNAHRDASKPLERRRQRDSVATVKAEEMLKSLERKEKLYFPNCTPPRVQALKGSTEVGDPFMYSSVDKARKQSPNATGTERRITPADVGKLVIAAFTLNGLPVTSCIRRLPEILDVLEGKIDHSKQGDSNGASESVIEGIQKFVTDDEVREWGKEYAELCRDINADLSSNINVSSDRDFTRGVFNLIAGRWKLTGSDHGVINQCIQSEAISLQFDFTGSLRYMNMHLQQMLKESLNNATPSKSSSALISYLQWVVDLDLKMVHALEPEDLKTEKPAGTKNAKPQKAKKLVSQKKSTRKSGRKLKKMGGKTKKDKPEETLPGTTYEAEGQLYRLAWFHRYAKLLLETNKAFASAKSVKGISVSSIWESANRRLDSIMSDGRSWMSDAQEEDMQNFKAELEKGGKQVFYAVEYCVKFLSDLKRRKENIAEDEIADPNMRKWLPVYDFLSELDDGGSELEQNGADDGSEVGGSQLGADKL